MVPGEGVYGEKRVAVEEADKGKIEYRVWNPFRSKLAAAVLGGVDKIHMLPGSKVLYLGAASGTSVSHVSDIVGPVRFKHFRFRNWQLICRVFFSDRHGLRCRILSPFWP